MLFGIFEIFLEFLVELGESVGPGLLALFDFIQLFFEVRRVLHVENVAEVLNQQIGDDQANLSRRELAAHLLYVLTLLDGGENRRISRGTANAALFQFLHQRRLVVARRRFGEVLLGLQFLERKFLPGFERRQLVLEFLVFFVLSLFGLFIDSQESVELEYRSGHTEPEHLVAILGVDVDRRLIKHRRIDLRSDETLPDQLVDLELIFS